MGDVIGEDEPAAFHRTVGRLRELPVDDSVRLRAEQVAETAAADAGAMAATATGARDRREDAPLPVSGDTGVFRKPRNCYVCKLSCRQVDAFYHRLCPRCAADNTANPLGRPERAHSPR